MINNLTQLYYYTKYKCFSFLNNSSYPLTPSFTERHGKIKESSSVNSVILPIFPVFRENTKEMTKLGKVPANLVFQ